MAREDEIMELMERAHAAARGETARHAWPRQDVEDLAQEALRKWCERTAPGAAGVHSPKAWLRQVVRNDVVDAIRWRARWQRLVTPVVSLEELAGTAPSTPEERAAARAALSQLPAAVESLPPKMRRAFKKRLEGGRRLTDAERRASDRARRRLRCLLD